MTMYAFDYGLFFENIRANIAERIEAFVHQGGMSKD
jgi:hypothetical protein